MQISFVPQDVISKMPRVIEFLKRVEPYSLPRCDAFDFYMMCLSGEASLWGIFADDVTAETLDQSLVGVAVTRYSTYPKGRMLTVMALAGDEFGEWLVDYLEILKSIQQRDGLLGIEEWGRPGWIKKLKNHGFQQSYVLMEYLGEQGIVRHPVEHDVDSHAD